MKQDWTEVHEELVAEYLEMHPDVSWGLAYDVTAPLVNDRLADKHAAMIDHARMMQKEAF